jgi:hypothetical protein
MRRFYGAGQRACHPAARRRRYPGTINPRGEAMKKLISLMTTLGLALCIGGAYAATPAASAAAGAASPGGKAAQQNKMKTCNKQAQGKKGDERKKFMSECLKK